MPVALGVGLQGVILALAPLVLVVAITARAGGQDQDYLGWAVFATLLIAGGLTALQGSTLGRLGAGHMLIMGATPNYVAVSVLALIAGGPPLLASLIVVSAFFYLALANWLPLLRRVITPVVSGTVLMLIATALLPISLDRVGELPAGVTPIAGPVIAAVTLTVAVGLALRASGSLRLWSPLVGIATGCLTAVAFGAFDLAPLLDAPWAGLPAGGFPGLDLTPGAEYWALLPVFVVIVLVGAIKNIGDTVAMQQASRRRPRAIDYRRVQGSLYANGLGIFLSGLAGTPPTTVYSATSVSLANLTGVASRHVGYVIGALLLTLALFPKLPALLLTVPNPVMGAYILLATGLLFVEGLRTVVGGGLDLQKMVVVGTAFALGAGVENQTLFADAIGGTWGGQLDSGMLIGALAAIAMTGFLELTNPRRGGRLRTNLDPESLAGVDVFICRVAQQVGWSDPATVRLRAAAEEAFLTLSPESDGQGSGDAPEVVISARPGAGFVELEFMITFAGENLEDQVQLLETAAAAPADDDSSLRLLRHYADAVQHRKFYGRDVVSIQVRGGP